MVLPTLVANNEKEPFVLTEQEEVGGVFGKLDFMKSAVPYRNIKPDASHRGVGGRDSQGIGSWLACHEFEPSTTKDPPCKDAMLIKSVELKRLPVGIDSKRTPSVPNASTLSITPRGSSSRDVLSTDLLRYRYTTLPPSRVTNVGIDSKRAPSVPNASTLSITPRGSSSPDVLSTDLLRYRYTRKEFELQCGKQALQ
ncbi:hypothetical protein TNCV_87001 [Trichonephila clavipes]|nr:hypothetical protein TNCV_87001 [Trichonephila clavipes]